MAITLKICEVLACASNGLTQKEAADSLNVSLSSLKRFLKANNLNQTYGKRLKDAKEARVLNDTLKRLKEFKNITEALEAINLYSFTENIRKLYVLGKINESICKKCSCRNNYSYGIGVFCGVECARGYSTMYMSEEAKEKRSSGLRKGKETQIKQFSYFQRINEKGECSVGDEINLEVEDYLPIINNSTEVKGLIYRHVSPSGKSYVGQTIRGS